MSAKFTHCVIGGGIVGLAVAAKLSYFGSTVLLEKNAHLLSETSSHNSGVLHRGIYYPSGSLKASLCIQGNNIIQQLMSCDEAPVGGRLCGKWIGSVDAEEDTVLEELAQLMKSRNIPFEMVAQQSAAKLEPLVRFRNVLHSPETGIFDVHTLARYYERIIEKNSSRSTEGTFVQTNCKATRIKRHGAESFLVDTADGASLHANFVINCGGLWSNDVSEMLLGEVPPGTRQFFLKGRYVKYACSKPIFSHLVYPCPLPNLKSLGVHATIDLGGAVRFGPDAIYVASRTDYSAPDDPVLVNSMFQAVRRYVPTLEREKLQVEFSGIRPKLSQEGEAIRDFVIRRESALGFKNFVTLAGIESPGLTSSPAIGSHVAHQVLQYPPIPWEFTDDRKWL